jgi:hypothetical protein
MPELLSTNSPTKDEDPNVLRASDGAMYVVWFSDRGGNPDIYIARIRAGESWSPATRVTTHPGGDYYPNLIQDQSGVFHLVWFRWTALNVGQILSSTSIDGLVWDETSEVPVTNDPNVDDWVPTITDRSDGALLVYFVSEVRDGANATNELFVSVRQPGTNAWDAPMLVPGINSSTEHDHLPFAARIGGTIALVWVRHDTTQSLPWLGTKSDLYFSTSPDGLSWAAPAKVTNDTGDILHLFPAFTSSLDGAWSLVWLSTRLGPPRVFELPFDEIGSYPSSATEIVALPEGYSHRIAATPTPGVALGAWVQGPEGMQDVYVRLF